jgi:hypothetical protein
MVLFDASAFDSDAFETEEGGVVQPVVSEWLTRARRRGRR